MKPRSLSIAISLAVLAVTHADIHAAPAVKSSASSAFNADSVSVSTKPLPAFPYLEWPERLKPIFRKEKEWKFNKAHFVAGKALHVVEGRMQERYFRLASSGLSRVEALRNYEQAIKALGGVRINTIQPADKEFVTKNGGNSVEVFRHNLGINDNNFDYAAYLIRTPRQRAWIAVAVSNSYVYLRTVEENAMEQSVGLTKADEMKAALDQQGHVALYINFDTDKAALRDDGKPIVEEIVKLLKANPDLKISVEGHTDDTGDAQRNKVLSEQRAATIVKALTASGIAAPRLGSAGFGAEKPLADNTTEAGRARNRRVEHVKR
jgi:outer membrane protein OmpA-like peptidoglycan-associated protein